MAHGLVLSAVSLVAGIVQSLRNLLKDEDITVRQKSTECLYVMSCKFIQNLIISCIFDFVVLIFMTVVLL